MSIEESHGKPRMTRPRLTDLPAGATAADRNRVDRTANGKFKPGNRCAVGRRAKEIISGRERQVLKKEIERSVGLAVPSTEQGQLFKDIVGLYKHTLSELPAHGAVVLASTMAFARESVIASVLIAAATEAGLTTDRGLQLLDAAQKAEKRAEQASVHAFTISTRLAAKPGKVVDVPWFVPADEPEPVKP